MRFEVSSSPTRKPAPVVSRIRITVAFHHTDMMQVVHNAQYFKWFELGRLEILQRFMTVEWAAANDVAMPVVMNHAEYLAPAKFGDELVVTTRHEPLDRWSGRFGFIHSISNTKTKVELCRGASDVTVMHLKTLRVLKELPAEAWERYRAL